MDSDERIRRLEGEVERLREKEKKLEHDLALYREIFTHLKKQFEEMKRQLLNK
jgi:predicted  nucleic acid-binding Zn-ribbon protein